MSYLQTVDEQTVPTAGMTISVRTRRDVVIVDPERFLASARAAYHDLYPEASRESAAENVRDVYDAVHVLLDHFGRLAADAPETMIRCGHGEPQPGQRVLDRPDGLSPAGELQRIILGDQRPLQDYGCFLPEDPFALPPNSQL
ncbi:hypothetical protein [Nonomuraea turcica]|uniref:hypothetical protein n=1 Tax=Nonomuraea sp. G32 TaxID=3067274 RepID=UPI00273BDE11|nr:hypothetical protein [Nonomuraea sp. G32]MDP4511345.1 hypothetical protein [Nonomuraea sp. G32]